MKFNKKYFTIRVICFFFVISSGCGQSITRIRVPGDISAINDNVSDICIAVGEWPENAHEELLKEAENIIENKGFIPIRYAMVDEDLKTIANVPKWKQEIDESQHDIRTGDITLVLNFFCEPLLRRKETSSVQGIGKYNKKIAVGPGKYAVLSTLYYQGKPVYKFEIAELVDSIEKDASNNSYFTIAIRKLRSPLKKGLMEMLDLVKKNRSR